MSPETVAYVRDWVIIVWGVITTVAALGILIVTLLLYRKLSAIMNSTQGAARGVREFSRQVMEEFSVLGPILNPFSRRRGERHEEEAKNGRHQTRETENKFVPGLLLGLAIGGALGLLLAPRPGKQTRAMVMGKAEDRGERIPDVIDEAQDVVRVATQKIRGDPKN